ncbi:hypothetical protein Leryth_023704 [Lithospermum erythrorhizon]|nr:hypothetical protein Leryth_023704 [Lithospermum erythrorhizon]
MASSSSMSVSDALLASNPGLTSFNHVVNVKLDVENYVIWKSQVLPTLRGLNLVGFMEGTSICPSEYVLADVVLPRPLLLLLRQLPLLLLMELLIRCGFKVLLCISEYSTKRFNQQFSVNDGSGKSALIATPTSMNDPAWYVNSGASNHLTSDFNNVSLATPYEGNDHITVGNGESLPIQHTGPTRKDSTQRHY